MLSIFTPSFLICLAIIIILVGGMFMFFNQKITQQNDKINGMFDLVNTMAEELTYIRSGSTIQPFSSQNQNQHVLTNLGGGFRQSENELIQVSDDEDEDDEDEDDDEDDEDDEDDDDDDEDEDEDEDDEEDDDKAKNIKIINILSESIYGIDHNDVEIIEQENNKENDDDEDSDDNDDDQDDDEDDDNDLSNEDDEPVELIDLINHNVLEDNTPTEEIVTISSNGENYTFDLNLLKNIDISNTSSNENIDYKKMSLTKLREIVVERNLATDASKMKKNELLKLLE